MKHRLTAAAVLAASLALAACGGGGGGGGGGGARGVARRLDRARREHPYPRRFRGERPAAIER